MKKIGLLGGTFDPIHNQHLNIAKAAYHKLNLDEVWIIPTKQNPLKDAVVASDVQRLAMINIAIADYSWLKINDYELTSTQPSYTINTITYLTEQYPQYQFYFIIGSDNLYTLHQWQGIETIIDLAQVVVVNRPHYRKTITLMKKYRCRNLVVYPSSTISSAKIRTGELTNATNSDVRNYINDNLIYGKCRLTFNLQEQTRVQHSLNVADMAQKLAEHYQLDGHKAYIAGFYHDLCKQWSKTKMMQWLKEYHYDHVVQEPWPVWHGYVAALYLEHHYYYHDKDILTAVAQHTTGALKMEPLSLVVLLADKVALERTKPDVTALRALAFQDLTLAFCAYLRILKKHLVITKQPLTNQFWLIYKSWHKKEEKQRAEAEKTTNK